MNHPLLRIITGVTKQRVHRCYYHCTTNTKMPKIVGRSTRVVEHDGLTIDEYVGNVACQTDQVSLAVVKIAEPTSEPWLTLDYDEWIAVIKGKMDMHSQKDGQEEVQVLSVNAGETVFVAKGERFRPVFPEAGTEYIPICIPAFKPERCQREEEDGINTSKVADKLAKLHSKNKNDILTSADEGVQSSTSSSDKKTVYHMCQKALWEKVVAAKTAYFPPTYIEDGFFTHATAVPTRLLETANHFYTSTQGEWVCLELSTETLLANGIMTVFEEPKPVGDQTVQEHWKSDQWACPHIYGGIPCHIPGTVTKIYEMERDSDGLFLSIAGLTTKAA
jgi:uncharacterized protein (DUF952 family)/ethanolamine utilization protein EutQ (cupin superfamily)